MWLFGSFKKHFLMNLDKLWLKTVYNCYTFKPSQGGNTVSLCLNLACPCCINLSTIFSLNVNLPHSLLTSLCVDLSLVALYRSCVIVTLSSLPVFFLGTCKECLCIKLVWLPRLGPCLSFVCCSGSALWEHFFLPLFSSFSLFLKHWNTYFLLCATITVPSKDVDFM